MNRCIACAGPLTDTPVRALTGRDISDASRAWNAAAPAEQLRWAGRSAFMAVWITKNVLEREAA